MITLALSSSTALVAVAVARDGQLLAEDSTLTDRRHAEEITPMLRSVLSEGDIAVGAIDRIVLDIGPGRYTGMRVGIATAKALAFALSIRIVPVTSLQLLAAAAESIRHDGPRFAAIDARRNQIFAQRVNSDDAAVVVSPDQLIELIPDRALLFGDGADRYAESFSDIATVAANVVPSISAAALWDPASTAFPASEIEPLYLREPDAAINIKTRPAARKGSE